MQQRRAVSAPRETLLSRPTLPRLRTFLPTLTGPPPPFSRISSWPHPGGPSHRTRHRPFRVSDPGPRVRESFSCSTPRRVATQAAAPGRTTSSPARTFASVALPFPSTALLSDAHLHFGSPAPSKVLPSTVQRVCTTAPWRKHIGVGVGKDIDIGRRNLESAGQPRRPYRYSYPAIEGKKQHSPVITPSLHPSRTLDGHSPYFASSSRLRQPSHPVCCCYKDPLSAASTLPHPPFLAILRSFPPHASFR